MNLLLEIFIDLQLSIKNVPKSIFKAHEDVNFLDTLKTLAEDGKYLNRPMQLELYTSSNFMGFFVKEDDANVMKRIGLKFVKEIQDSSMFINFNIRLTVD
jgi:hypothetical protein